MELSSDLQQMVFVVILITSFILLITERLRNDLVALLIILALSVTGLLTAEEALAGFSSEPAIIVAAIFVLSSALERTGVSETLGQWFGRFTGKTYDRALGVIMPSVALLSAFTHHLTTTALMLPVVLDLSRRLNIAPSKLLMPLAFAASLGTSITIIGAPAFLIASASLQQAGRPALGIFSIAPIGLALTLVGTVFMIVIGRYLIPTRKDPASDIGQLGLIQYFTELKILPDSDLIGKTLEQVKEDRQYQFTVAGWVRDGRRLRGPFLDDTLQVEDVLLVHATPEDLATFSEDNGIELHPIEKFGLPEGSPTTQEETFTARMVQAIVAPTSHMIGRTLRDIDFRRRYGALVVAFWRRGSFVQRELARIKLKAGDVLVLQGDDDGLSRVARDPAFLMIVPFDGEPRIRKRGRIAALIMIATVLVAMVNVFPLQIVMLGGAIAVVLTGCLTAPQALRAIDARIYIFIAGAIPLGTAMQTTGTSEVVAQWLGATIGGWSPILILLVLFAISGILTQFMSDAATTALLSPLVVALANSLGHAPEAYVITVAMAAVVSFLTPIGHHGNLLIYGPGGYKFSDFVRVGTPLTIILAVTVVLVSMLLWSPV